MGQLFFTSDWHIGHENIIRYCQRPFASVAEMDLALIRNYNEMVTDQDTCYFIGDICMGDKQITLNALKTLRGKKILITGNHDLVFRLSHLARAQKYKTLYLNAGFEEIHDHFIIYPTGFSRGIRLYHFPYLNAAVADSHEYETRFLPYRLEDDGILLLHGHTHHKTRKSGDNSIHIGVDAWDFRPVPLSDIRKIMG